MANIVCQDVILYRVESTFCSHVGYDLGTNTLRILTHHGDMYDYEEVPVQRYAAMVSADSIGQYYNRYIKNCYGHHPIDYPVWELKKEAEKKEPEIDYKKLAKSIIETVVYERT